MISLGIDLSSQKANTSAAVIEWQSDKAIALAPVEKCADATLDSLIATADAVGIDAPFGWPQTFRHAVANWEHLEWNNALRDLLRFRETDRMARKYLGRWPLSVSSDLVALPAMRAMALLKRHKVSDKSGQSGKFYEVYPAGSMRSWNLDTKGYKKKRTRRLSILRQIREQLPWLEVDDHYAESDHNLDALVCSLTAQQSRKNETLPPLATQQQFAASEGWIHLPSSWPDLDPA